MLEKKICMLGSFAVGKTSLVRRFVESIYSDVYHTTVGVKIDKKVMQAGGQELSLVLWIFTGKTITRRCAGAICAARRATCWSRTGPAKPRSKRRLIWSSERARRPVPFRLCW